MFIKSKADCLSDWLLYGSIQVPPTIFTNICLKRNKASLKNIYIMSATNLSAPSKLVPVSTMLAYLSYYLGVTICFLLLLNPLSMFLINLLKPSCAASLAHNKIFCGQKVCRFYTVLASKWPFKWSKWWVVPEDIGKLSDERQADYFYEVDNSKEVLWSLRPEVWVQIMKNNSLDLNCSDDTAENLKKRDDLFAALLELVKKAQDSTPLLRDYMRYGTLPKSQMAILVEKVCEEGKELDLGKLLDELCEYIERCGISKELLNKISQDNNVFLSVKELVTESNDSYLQKVTTKRLCNLNSPEQIAEWNKFCAPDKYIRVSAQQQMSLEQYKIFHRNGHLLDGEVIPYLIWHGGKEIAELIFRYEPKFGIQNQTTEFILDRYEYLRPLLTKVITSTENGLRKRIDAGERLNERQLNKLFDCPSAGDLAMDYVSNWPLPDALQMRMLELKNADELVQFYAVQEQNNKHYHLTFDVCNKVKKDGLIDKLSENAAEVIKSRTRVPIGPKMLL